MESSSPGPVVFEVEGRVGRLRLNRPEKLNALNDEVRLALGEALDELEERPEVSVLVLEGTGRSFCAGADLKATAYPPVVEGDWVQRRHRTGSWQRLLDQLGRIPQATVAALHGHVIGGGALLAAAFDIRLAADDTVLRIPELAIGMPLTWAGVPLLAREVGLPAARDWVMSSRSVDADELLRTGYVTRLVPRSELDRAVATCIDQLLSAPPGPLAMTRAMTAAIGRATPTLATGWADPDHQHWTFTEEEYRASIRRYIDGTASRPS